MFYSSKFEVQVAGSFSNLAELGRVIMRPALVYV